MRVERLGLEPDEQLLAAAGASFRGAAAASARSTFSLGSEHSRQKSFEAWSAAALETGFPTGGPEMTLCVTNRRLIVCRQSFWLSRPAGAAGSIELERIAEVAIVRHGLVTGVALAIANRGHVEVEALRGRQLRRLGLALRDAIAERAP